MKDDVTYCNGCNCMTKSIRKTYFHYVCGKCGSKKTYISCKLKRKKQS